MEKSCLCKFTEMLGDDDFEGNTMLVASEDIRYNHSLSMKGDNEYVFISGFEIIKFSTEEIIIDFKSIMGSN